MAVGLNQTHPDLVKIWWSTDRNTIDPSEVSKGSKTEVFWQCPDHDIHVFKASVAGMVRRTGCRLCSKQLVIPGVNDAMTTHGSVINKIFDFDNNDLDPNTVSSGTAKKFNWKCPECSTEWVTSMMSITRGSGCPTCAGTRVKPGFNDIASTHSSLVASFWDYNRNTIDPKNISKGSTNKVWWLCPKCYHSWDSAPYNVIGNGSRCPLCSNKVVVSGINDLSTTDPDVVKTLWSTRNSIEPTLVHRGSNTPRLWECLRGHQWSAPVSDVVVRGTRCRSCSKSVSDQEREVHKFISDSYTGDVLFNDRTILEGQEIDIYIPEYRLAIEYNGVYYHSTAFNRTYTNREKYEKIISMGMNLLIIWSDDWKYKQDVVKSQILHRIGLGGRRIGARKTEVVEMDVGTSREFMDLNHIQGAGAGGSIRLGLRDRDSGDIVAAMTLQRRSSEELELTRYCTSTSVPGGHSKMISFVDRNYTFDRIVTFADRCVSSGGLYESTGWTDDKQLRPDYWYLRGDRRVNKRQFRKKAFKDSPDLKYDSNMTESEMAELNSIYRIYDIGKIRYIHVKGNLTNDKTISD